VEYIFNIVFIDFEDILDNRMVTKGEKMTEFVHAKVKKWIENILVLSRNNRKKRILWNIQRKVE